MNHQYLPTTIPAGTNSYQAVPITIPKEEGRMCPTLGVGGGRTARAGSLLRSEQCQPPGGDTPTAHLWLWDLGAGPVPLELDA